MATPSPEELEQLHEQIAALVQQARTIFDAIPLTAAERQFAKDAAGNVAHHAISLWTRLRPETPDERVRMVAVSVALASALAVVDANARVTDAFSQ
jgi:hypothetical protein